MVVVESECRNRFGIKRSGAWPNDKSKGIWLFGGGQNKDVKNGATGGASGNEPPALFVRQRIVGLLCNCIRGTLKGFRSSPVPADII